MRAWSISIVCSSLLAASLLLNPTAAMGQSDAGVRTHDGFFMRFLAGAGPGAVTLDDVLGQELMFSLAAATNFHFQIGGMVGPNLALFADLGGFSMTNPDVDWGANTGSIGDTEVVVSGFGVGATYYWMPANVYVSASALASRSNLTFQGSEASSEFGGTAFVAFGKEWWIGDQWGIGVALYGDFGTMKDQPDSGGDQATMTTSSVGVAVSVTLN